MEPPWAEVRRHARSILLAAVEAADAERCVRRALREDPLDDPGPVTLAALGKAAPAMARAARDAHPDAGGVVAAPGNVLERETVPGGLEVLAGGHPLPTQDSVAAGEALLAAAERVPEDGTLLALVSGGGSACAEVPRVPLEALRATTRLLLERGVPIGDANILRRRLSELKGGGLAAACPGRVVGLVLSDVPGDDPADVASGPTSPDPTTWRDAERVLRDHALLGEMPPEVRRLVEERGPDPGAGGRVTNRVVGSNRDALLGAAERARELGYPAELRPGMLAGEAREVGPHLVEEAQRLDAPACLLAGGETTVTVTGDGVGGRNQELVLGAVEALDGTRLVLAALGTDGVDGPTDAAGALADGRTRARAREEGLDPERFLEENGSHRFHRALDDLIVTGATGTNVMDVAVVLSPGTR